MQSDYLWVGEKGGGFILIPDGIRFGRFKKK